MKSVLLRISAVISLLKAVSSLLFNGKRSSSSVQSDFSFRPSSPLFMSIPPREVSTRVQASATTLVSTTTQEAATQSTNSALTRRRKRKWQSGRPPTVDSTLLRFIGQQKESLEPLVRKDFPSSNELSSYSSSDYLYEISAPYEHQNTDKMRTWCEDTNSAVLQNSPSTWWGQYNSHRVETVLLSMDSTLDRTEVSKAAARVQAQVLARTVRRRIRTFLKERDQTWKSDLVSALTIGSVGEMIQDSGGHLFEDTLRVLQSHGLAAKDIVEILQHSPGIVLMRPRGARENGECLDDTIDRVFKLLCVTLKLRKYDARKIVRSSPGLLTMRGSKSAENVVLLMSRMGVSPNALARDKATLTVFLGRSPAALFRLVAFLSSDAIRMPVDKIGPLLRRPVSLELLNAVAPIPKQMINLDNDTGMHAPSYEEDFVDGEVDLWIASALWSSQSQIRRDRINEIYRKMTKTAWTLRNEIGTADLSKVVAAYPSVLLLDAEEQILPTANYLMTNLGILEGDLPRVLQLYPLLLGLPTEKMESVLRYLLSLGVTAEDLSTVFRAFPAILTLEIKQDMEPVVQFLLSIGVMNIGRFLTRIPSVLGFSVDDDLLPKWQLLKSVAGDARFEVTKFPAYFSYPLDRVIRARYEYIRDVKNFPTQLITADKVLSYGDRDFAVKILREEDEGRAFQEYLNRRNNPPPSVNRQRHEQPNNRNGGDLV